MAPRSCSIHKLVGDVCLLADGHVLLVRYKDTAKYDGQEGWFLPDDFLLHGEHPDQSARRILREQTGLTTPVPQLSHVESFGSEVWHVVFHYKALLGKRSQINPQENVKEAKWFSLKELPDAKEVAHHGWGLETIEKVLKTSS